MDTPANPAKPVITLVLLVAALTAVVALVASVTRERIVHNEQAWILQRLDALVAPAIHDNDLLADSIAVTAPDLLGSAQPVRIYRARRTGAPVAGAKVTSIFFGDRVVWSNSDGIDTGVFASTGFLRGLLKGQSIRAGLDVIINGTVPTPGDFSVTLIGQKPIDRC